MEEYTYFNPNLTLRRRRKKKVKKDNSTKKEHFEFRKCDNHVRVR